jgi:3-hydroxyacyl-[acyl-carrier-protein] dehydratase
MSKSYNIDTICQILPHRYPFLLVDRVLEVIPGERIRALKNVTVNEPFFIGHLPENPVMPGVLIIEGMVQAAALLFSETLPVEKHGDICFSGIDKARFRKTVIPGDQLIYEVEMVRRHTRGVIMKAVTTVEGIRVAEARVMAIIGGKR